MRIFLEDWPDPHPAPYPTLEGRGLTIVSTYDVLHILRIRIFEWDEDNAEHLVPHDVSPDQVEEALTGRLYLRRGRRGRYYGYGRTAEGRYLFVVFVSRGPGRVRVITARDMTDGERSLYQRKVMT